MKDSFLFNISNIEGLPNGANEQTSNILGAMSIAEHVFSPELPFEELELTDDEIEEYRAGGYEVEEVEEYKHGGPHDPLPAEYLKSEGFVKAANQDLDSLLSGFNTDGYDSHWYEGDAENYGVTSDQLRTFAGGYHPKSFVNAAAYSQAMNKLANDAGGKNVINTPFADNPMVMRTADDDVEYVEYEKPTTLQEEGYMDETGTNAVNQYQSRGLAKRYTQFEHGGPHNEGYSTTRDGNTYTEVISNRPNDSYEYKREKDTTTGDINYFTRKKGTDSWSTAGEEGTTGYRAITNVFGEDDTGYATSDERREFIRGELVKRAEEEAEKNAPPPMTYDPNDPKDFNTRWDLENKLASNSDATGTNYYQLPNVLGESDSDAEYKKFIEDEKTVVRNMELDAIINDRVLDAYMQAGKNISGIQAAEDLYNKGFTKVIGDVANTAADAVGIIGEGIYEAGDYLVGDGSFDIGDKNWITGNEYGSGLDTVLDIASIIPAGKLLKAGKLVSPLISGTTKTLAKGKNAFVKGLQASTDALGDIRLGTVGAQPLTVGDIGNYVHKGLKYKKFAPNTGIGAVDKFTDKWASGYGMLGAMGVDATVRGDNTYSDVFSGNYDPTKSALGRLSINAADDLSLINESRKNASMQNVIDDGYSFNDALKVGINLSPLKAIRSMAGEERLGETLVGAPQAVTKFTKKLTDKSGGIDNKTDYGSPRTVYLAAQRQEGGTVQEQYLTDAEIAALEAQGYRIEDIS